VGALDNYSLVFVIFINFFGQLKDWVGQVLFLVSCPMGQVEKYVNVEAWLPVNVEAWLPVQTVPITTKVVSLNPAYGEVYLIQHYVIKFVNDLPPSWWFSPGTPVSAPPRYNWNIVESGVKHHNPNQTKWHLVSKFIKDCV
jgi:hypothetical protein